MAGGTTVIPFLDEKSTREHKRLNMLHTVLLIAGLTALVAVSAMLLMGWAGLGWAAVLLGVMVVFAPRIPPEVLIRMYRGRRVDPGSGGQISEIVDELAHRAGLPARPTLYVIPSMTLNAFAAGRPEHAVIALTEGTLRRLTMREIAGVLAHEMSHIRNNDLWVMGLADALTRLSQSLSYVAVFLAILNVFAALQGEQVASWIGILLLYFAPALSSLLQLALSRAREFDADLEGAQLTGDPLGLASALRRIDAHTGRFWEDILPPVPGRRVGYPSLLRSHPPTEERVRRLVSLSAKPMPAPMVVVDKPMISLVGFGPIEMRPRYRFPGLWF
jgi:heat shock protein HtpX